MDFAATWTAVAAKVATISRLRKVYDELPDDLSAPCAVLHPVPGTFATYKRTFDGTVDLQFLLTIFEQNSSTSSAQDNLKGYVSTSGSTSVFAALSGAAPGSTNFAVVVSAQNFGDVLDVASVPHATVQFLIEVSTL